jgi:hypothetical protein
LELVSILVFFLVFCSLYFLFFLPTIFVKFNA